MKESRIKMSNIREVATKAGVSVATVSRVLNNHDSVTDDTKAKVQEAIRSLNYQPSMLGRNLRNSESRLLLVLIPEISNPYYFEVIKGIEETVLQNHYHILLCETGSDPSRENIYFDLVKSKMADGIISMDPAVNIDTLKQLSENHAIIQCSEYETESGIPYVTIDHELAAYEAVQHLIALGHEKIAFINSDKKFLYARQRETGYMQALEENGLAIHADYMRYAEELGFDEGQQAMREILLNDEKPTAVFAVADLLAIGALKEIHAQELQVPDEMAIIGFDNIAYANMTYPVLSTVEQPMYEIGCHAAQMLINSIKGNKVNNVILQHQLIKRTSTIGNGK